MVAVLLALAAPTAGADDTSRNPGFLDRLAQGGTEEIDACEAAPADRGKKERVSRASEHFSRGVVLYEHGDYGGAVDEFVAAYCDAPNADVLYNIGQSFERLLKFEKAVAYFQLFILRSGDDQEVARQRAARRVQVLREMPARIRVATVPEGARITLESDAGVRARGVSGKGEPLAVQQGTYKLIIQKPGYRTIEQTIVAEIGQPYTYLFRLEAETGMVRITTRPRQARVFVDDKLVGIGSYAKPLPVGDHTVMVEAENRPPVTREIEVTAGNERKVRIELADPPDSGRTTLIVAATAGGLIYGSSALATVYGGDALAVTLGAAGGVAVGFAGSFFGTPDDITVGQSSYIITTSLVAAGEGALVAQLFTCETPDGATDDECADDVIGGAAVAAGVAGVVGGALTTRMLDLSAGDAAVLNSGALWGAATGALFYAAFDASPKARGPLLLAGLNLGVIAGATIAARAEISRGRAALIDLSGLGGVIAGVALAQAAQTTDTERVDHFALGGMAVGLIAGTWFTRFVDDPDPDTLRMVPAAGAAKDSAGKATLTFGVTSRF